jgi:hypothetical protein
MSTTHQPRPYSTLRPVAHIDLPILESFLQVIVDRLIRYLANQGQIRDTDFLLLCRVECGLLDIGFTASSSRLGCFVAFRPPTYSLFYLSARVPPFDISLLTIVHSCLCQCAKMWDVAPTVEDERSCSKSKSTKAIRYLPSIGMRLARDRAQVFRYEEYECWKDVLLQFNYDAQIGGPFLAKTSAFVAGGPF